MKVELPVLRTLIWIEDIDTQECRTALSNIIFACGQSFGDDLFLRPRLLSGREWRNFARQQNRNEATDSSDPRKLASMSS